MIVIDLEINCSESIEGLCVGSFSERYGYKSVRAIVQRESLDPETRVELWNLLVKLQGIFSDARNRFYQYDVEDRIVESIWRWYFREPLDDKPQNHHIWERIKTVTTKGDWNEVFDFLEMLIQEWSAHEEGPLEGVFTQFPNALNSIFEEHLVGYRMIGHEIAPIDSSVETEAVSSALESVRQIEGAKRSLERAVEFLSDRDAPNYLSSIHQSIMAVEATLRTLTGKRTVFDGLKHLENVGLILHPALEQAWIKMYGWASDEANIRHAGVEEAEIDQTLAKYTLVTCSAFVSYLFEEARKLELLKE